MPDECEYERVQEYGEALCKSYNFLTICFKRFSVCWSRLCAIGYSKAPDQLEVFRYLRANGLYLDTEDMLIKRIPYWS